VTKAPLLPFQIITPSSPWNSAPHPPWFGEIPWSVAPWRKWQSLAFEVTLFPSHQEPHSESHLDTHHSEEQIARALWCTKSDLLARSVTPGGAPGRCVCQLRGGPTLPKCEGLFHQKGHVPTGVGGLHLIRGVIGAWLGGLEVGRS
jgi:hypothetical protein